MRRLVALLIALPALLAPAPAVAAPELFVRMQTWDTHEAASDWIPLASAPSLDYLGGYEIGYRPESSADRYAVLRIDSVPDGQPTQPANDPTCATHVATSSGIVPAGAELQFEGVGTYSVTVAVGASNQCASGSSSGSFTVAVPVTPAVVGAPQTYRAKALRGFAGVRANQPPGGSADVRCELNGTTVGTGPEVPEWVFTRPGVWTCMARGVAEGQNESSETVEYFTPWSSPLSVDVASDFRRRLGVIRRPRAARPRFTFTAEWPALAVGGRGTVTISRVTGCRGRRHRLRRVAAYSGTFGARNMRVAMRRPRGRFFVARFTFSGTRLLRAGADPNPMLLTVQRGKMGFVDPRGFPRCP